MDEEPLGFLVIEAIWSALGGEESNTVKAIDEALLVIGRREDGWAADFNIRTEDGGIRLSIRDEDTRTFAFADPAFEARVQAALIPLGCRLPENWLTLGYALGNAQRATEGIVDQP